MTAARPPDRDRFPQDPVSTMSGTAHDVVQARDIRGGVHFHYPPHAPLGASHITPRQLPGAVPLFVGRVSELERLRELVGTEHSESLGGPRAAVIVGTAGAGKTSLALRFAHEVRHRFPDGHLFVDLRGYSAGDPVPPSAALNRFLRAMGVPAFDIPHSLEERAEVFRSLSADRAMLIVLDNVGTAGQARVLLPGSGDSLVLITSRGRLPTLSRFIGAAHIELGLFGAGESADMLNSIMRDLRDLRDTDSTVVGDLVTLCAGLPLALRIAAERAVDRPSTPLRALIDELRRESLSLTTDEVAGMTEGPVVSQPVESVFAWSYRHLPQAAAHVFRLLGLHPGAEFDLASAAALAGESPTRMREYLDVLVGAHLLEQCASGRFKFHDLLRAFAAQMAERQDRAEARLAALRRLADFYMAAIAKAASRLGETREREMAWFEQEKDTIVATAGIAAANGFHDFTWRLPVVAEPLFDAAREHEYWLETAELGLSAVLCLADPAAEAALRNTLGAAYRAVRDYRRAVQEHASALAVFEALGDRQGIARAANRGAVAHLLLREFPEAVASLHHALDALFPDENNRMRQFIIGNLAECYLDMDEPGEALRIAQTLPPASPPGAADDSHPAIANAVRLTRICTALGKFDQAERWAATYSDLTGNMRHQILLARAALRLEQGRVEDALTDYESCLEIQSAERVRGEADALDGMGLVLRLLGKVPQGLAFHHDAVAIRRRDADPFESARTLWLVSEACRQLPDLLQAAQARMEALELIKPYHDRKAENLRRRLNRPG